MIFKYLIFVLQYGFTYNEKSSCGCSVNNEGRRTENIYSESAADDIGQCSMAIGQDANSFDGMVFIPAGAYQVGTDDIVIAKDREGPKRIEKIESFYLDKFEVSNEEFSVFAKLTNYKTEAEIFGDSFVFSLFLNNSYKEKLEDFRVVQAPWWYKVQGANWQHPQGPDSDIADVMNHPVVHVSWKDAKAYCSWRGARLPSEAEWEAACRGGQKDTKYPWGDKLFPDKKYMANIWQGTFPHSNSLKDGFLGTNPVHLFPANGFGLYNMAGNVWEWTDDTWSDESPQEKVKKGGSYLCHKSYCYRYRCSARSHNTEDSSAANLGFRCAKSV